MIEDFKKQIRPGYVVQISPDGPNPMFACCLAIVSEVKPWGVQAYVQALGEGGNPGGQAYIRLKWDDCEYVGQAIWGVCGEEHDSD